jgi:hypothetical protein
MAMGAGAGSNIKNGGNDPSVPRTFGLKLINMLSERMIDDDRPIKE